MLQNFLGGLYTVVLPPTWNFEKEADPHAFLHYSKASEMVMVVSINGATSKSSISVGFSLSYVYINHPAIGVVPLMGTPKMALRFRSMWMTMTLTGLNSTNCRGTIRLNMGGHVNRRTCFVTIDTIWLLVIILLIMVNIWYYMVNGG